MKKLGSEPRVEYAEQNYRVQATGIPNDPTFGQLWGLRNTGQTVNGVSRHARRRHRRRRGLGRHDRLERR